MTKLIACALALTLVSVCLAQEPNPAPSTVRLSASAFRLIRDVPFEGRDLFELAIRAGMYKRKGEEHLLGEELGAVYLGGRTWHGSHGVGLVAYDPHVKRYSIYFHQEQAVPQSKVLIVYADEDFLFFTGGGYDKTLETFRPSLDVYSRALNAFVRVDDVSTSGAKFGTFSHEALLKKDPKAIPPAMGWDNRRLAQREWVDLTAARLHWPDRMVLEGEVIKLSYHVSWRVDEFVTTLQFKKSDFIKELEKLVPKKPEAGGPK
jgi:hypothetical protein